MPQPIASIIILTYNNLDVTRQCVESVLENTEESTYEIILVDNASSDGTQDYLRELAAVHQNVRILLNEKNEGFARGNNLGAALAQCEVIVFLNNDTIVTQGWLEGLLKRLDNPQVGMVGPVTNSSGNETRIRVDYVSIEDMPAFAKKRSKARRGKVFEIPMLAFLCVALRRSVYEEIGPLDESFGIGMFEDDDYALRLKAKGYKLLCVEDVFIHHWGSATFSRLDATEFWKLFQRNLKIFEEKWGIKWLPHPLRLEYIREQLRQYVDGLMGMAGQLVTYENDIKTLTGLVTERDEYIVDIEQKMGELYAQVQERDKVIAVKNKEILIRDDYIAEIARSRAWRLVKWLWRIRLLLFPHDSIRERMLYFLLRPILAWRRLGTAGLLEAIILHLGKTPPGRFTAKTLGKMVPKSVRNFYNAWREVYPMYDHTKVILFADDAILPDYSPRHALEKSSNVPPVKVSLISTVLNEATHAREWLESLLLQSRYPDELLITDGGSTDNTVEVLRQIATNFPFPIKVIESPGANIAHGRNVAIQNASFPIIACSDFGCVFDKDWLHRLILPFDSDEKIEVSAGYYHSTQSDDFGRVASSYFILDVPLVNPQLFLPSSRSLAMKKSVWEKAGGYPEFLTDAGEDTLFDYYAKAVSRHWAFVPQAITYWRAPNTFRKLFKTFYRYAQGDGETGTTAYRYWNQAKGLIWRMLWNLFLLLILVLGGFLANYWFDLTGVLTLLGIIVLLIGYRLFRRVHSNMKKWGVGPILAYKSLFMDPVIQMAMQLGFARGVKNRPKVHQLEVGLYAEQLKQIVARYPECKRIIVYPPTVDWGFMFQRPQQMARAFARKGYLHFFCTKNERIDDVIGFKEVEPNLIVSHVPLDTFHILDNIIIYAGTPWVNRMLSNFSNPDVIYDHFDEIDIFSAHPEDHLSLLRRADLVLVTAQRLLNNVKDIRPDVLFVPNGVDYEYVQQCRPSPEQPVPDDWQPIAGKGKPIVGYSGALAEWFDFELLFYLAKNRPDLEFVLLGVDYDGSLEKSGILKAGFDNIHWLGMKPYHELFHYLWQFDLGIIPFIINHLTLSTTPVKLFEYMACELPVITTAMPEARNYPGVFIAESHEQFLEHLDAAMKAKENPDYLSLINKVAREHTWESRVDIILARLKDITDHG